MQLNIMIGDTTKPMHPIVKATIGIQASKQAARPTARALFTGKEGETRHACACDWPEGCGLIVGIGNAIGDFGPKDEDLRQRFFFEAMPQGTEAFFHGEGATEGEAETAAWELYTAWMAGTISPPWRSGDGGRVGIMAGVASEADELSPG